MAAFDYDLPPSAIAQVPAEPRDSARLLVDQGPDRPARHRHVHDLPELVGAGDVIVVNTSKVLHARLLLHKPTGGEVEVLLLERDDDGWWDALVRPSRRVPVGTCLDVAPEIAIEVGERSADRRRVRFHGTAGEGEEIAVLDRAGVVPLPPYIHETLADPGRYQTTYAAAPGSVAAPTAGLHLTPAVLDACRATGATIASVDLRVGLGTFQPITAPRIEDHVMHAERYRVPAETMAACGAAGRVIAIGTTTLRALEASRRTGALEGRTDLFLRPDDPPTTVDALLTNFHLPRSSLLVLLESFMGPRWRTLYGDALAAGYRFLSFGDAMFVDRVT